jgi:polyphosphate glucokinase
MERERFSKQREGLQSRFAGWVGFDFRKALGRPVKIINDAAMQALGSYKGGKLLFLGLGTGLGSAMIADGVVEPMEIAHLRQDPVAESTDSQKTADQINDVSTNR